jgi:hypothetical protein
MEIAGDERSAAEIRALWDYVAGRLAKLPARGERSCAA